MAISGPPRDSAHPDRFTDCEVAIEAEFQRLVGRAMEAGWDETEVCTALTSLADHHVLGMTSNTDVSNQIASADPSGIVLRQR